MNEEIKFYSSRGKHGCFSNFSRHSVKIYGRTWKTSEHAYQAQKFLGVNEKRYNEIHKAANPKISAALGRDRSVKMRKDWEKKKYGVMKAIVRAKFTQHKALRQHLLDTGDAKLIEHTTNDKIWADGGDGSGKNWLGKILMEIREEIRSKDNG